MKCDRGVCGSVDTSARYPVPPVHVHGDHEGLMGWPRVALIG